MLRNDASTTVRPLRVEKLQCDLVVVGGGLAGTCCAITAARAGIKVVLIQDRPVLGGNASSEVRLWILGATSHMGNNNRWAREGGVINEILIENVYRNPEGNPLILDTILLEKAVSEPNITLLLNTAVHDLEKSDPDTIKTVRAFCSQNSTTYEVSAPLFCDASGDGIVGFLAGAAFRVGAEARAEFGELLAPEHATNEVFGHTIYFYSKDTGRPVKFTAPSFALKDITQIPRWRDIKAVESGCRLWWLEWGGRLDTIHDSETIKWELWKVVYGVWDYIKNSGRFPEAENLTLEWVGTIPGKRESRRFEGDYMLTQQDIVEQRQHADAVSFGGWAIDLHPADGVFSSQAPCQQWHSKGVYQIPYRTMYSRNIKNLFLAGRIISASHIAFSSTRVMATCAHNAQAVGMAAALCIRHALKPRDLLAPPLMRTLQRELIRVGQYIPGVVLDDPEDLVRRARLSATSELQLAELKPNQETLPLDHACAMMLPVTRGAPPKVTVLVDARQATTLRAELRVSSKPENYTPDVTLGVQEIFLSAGSRQSVRLEFDAEIKQDCYAFFCLMSNPALSVHLSDQRVTGVLSLFQNFNSAVAKSPRQEPPPNSGIEAFEFWLPQRRPCGKNLALQVEPPLAMFGVTNLSNGIARPTVRPNAWVAAFDDERPRLTLEWDEPQTIGRIELTFDTDWDHPLESVLIQHPERIMPFCVQQFVVVNGARKPVPGVAGLAGNPSASLGTDYGVSEDVLVRVDSNHQTRCSLKLDKPVITDRLFLHLVSPPGHIPAALFEIRCYES